MKSPPKFLRATKWKSATVEPLAGDASTRRYFRLRKGNETAILMDASRVREIVAPFVQINQHLQKLGFSAPEILARDDKNGLLLLEDFGDETFSHLLEKQFDSEKLFELATDVLIALHKHPQAAPKNLRAYHPQKMLEDVELFLEFPPSFSLSPPKRGEGQGEGVLKNVPPHPVPLPRFAAEKEEIREEFQKIWLDLLPLAHQVPASLLLRDYHVANLMLLPKRKGVRRAGLLDFQDAYAGPITYDLVSLLEDARRDVPAGLKEKMLACYLAEFPKLNRADFEISLAILAALRHTRVLAIFEKLHREGKSHYKKLHSPRVERLLQQALSHPKLAALKNWFAKHGR
ncbi:MAG TPA: phosphotransferase [Verrucomicrobiae bacterium]|nr:phosphotransferase [Verrucomicrobiae bacterium]